MSTRKKVRKRLKTLAKSLPTVEVSGAKSRRNPLAKLARKLLDKDVVMGDIIDKFWRVAGPGDTVTSAKVKAASEIAGDEAATYWSAKGRSAEDCDMVRQFYAYVGRHMAALFEPGRPLHNWVVPRD